MTSLNRRYYIYRGTLPGDAASYVTRQADNELLEGLRDADFCCVLSSRQMGKSSLMVRTAVRLKQEGASVAIVDLTGIGRNLTAAQWYLGLLSAVGQWLDLEAEIEEFWDAHERLSPLQRWMAALREVVLAKDERNIVIFIDEIDFVLTLPFSTDEFFAAIRECYNHRTRDAEYSRLTFCLLGVATPSDLIQDTRATPFNIGRRVQVTDFTPREAVPLAAGLSPSAPSTGDILPRPPDGEASRRDDASPREGEKEPDSLPEGGPAESRNANPEIGNQKLLNRVLYWTGGHPYLTQRLCQRVAETAVKTAAGVDRVCKELFLSASVREQEDNLMFVRDRLLGSAPSRADVLTLYGRVRGGKPVRNDETNPLVSILKLSGIVRVEAGHLKVRNRVYHRQFDRAWVTENMPDAEARRQKAAYRRGVARAALGSAGIVAVMAVLAFMAAKNAYVATANERRARENLYSVDLVLGMQAWTSGNLAFAGQLLDHHRGENFRGFEWSLLERLCQGDALWRSNPIKQAVNSVAFSPDGALMAAAADDNTVVIWNMQTRQPTRLRLRHSGGANSVAFAPNGKMLAAAWGDGTVDIWDIARRREVVLHDPHVQNANVQRVEFSRDGGKLAAAAYNGTVTLWDPVSHKMLWTEQEADSNVQSLAFAPDSKSLAVGTYDKVILRGTECHAMLASFPAEIGFVQCVRFSPGGRWLAASGFGCNLWLWNLATGTRTVFRTTHLGSVSTLAFSPDEKLLATGSSDDTLRVWSLEKRPFEKICTLRGHTDALTSVAFHPRRRTMIATSSADGTVRLWDASHSGEPRTLTPEAGPILSVAISPDRRRLAAGSNNGSILIWDLCHLDRAPARLERAHSTKVYSLAYSPHGEVLASASADGTVKVWRVNQGPIRQTAVWQGGNRVLAVAFTPDGTRLAATGWDKIVRVWRVPNNHYDQQIFGSRPDEYTGARYAADGDNRLEGNALAISPDSQTLAANSKDHKIYLWRLAEGPGRKPDTIAALDGGKVDSLAFSRDGKILAYGSEAKTVVLCNLRTRRQTPRTGHTSSVWSLAFSPDGRTLATGSPDLSVKLWHTDPDMRNEVASLSGHANAVMAVAFSADGQLLVSADYDGEVKLWCSGVGARDNAQPH